jgi:hypothetical protein
MDKRVQDVNIEILQYREAAQELFAGIIPEGMLYELEQISMGGNVSVDVTNEIKSVCMKRRKQAWFKLAQLSNLRPPVSAIQIHDLYLNAMIRVIEALRAALNGNLFKATATFEISSNLLMKTEELWRDISFD